MIACERQDFELSMSRNKEWLKNLISSSVGKNKGKLINSTNKKCQSSETKFNGQLWYEQHSEYLNYNVRYLHDQSW